MQGSNYNLTRGLITKRSKPQRVKMHIAVNTKTAPFPLLFIFLTRPKRTPTAAQPLLLQLSHFMVGRNGIVFSGYKSQRTTEQKRGNKRKNWGEEQEQRKKRKPEKNRTQTESTNQTKKNTEREGKIKGQHREE